MKLRAHLVLLVVMTLLPVLALAGPDDESALRYAAASVMDRPHIQRVIATRQPQVSDLIQGRTIEGRFISLAVPVVRDNRVAYVLAALYDLNVLSGVLSSVSSRPTGLVRCSIAIRSSLPERDWPKSSSGSRPPRVLRRVSPPRATGLSMT